MPSLRRSRPAAPISPDPSSSSVEGSGACAIVVINVPPLDEPTNVSVSALIDPERTTRQSAINREANFLKVILLARFCETTVECSARGGLRPPPSAALLFATFGLHFLRHLIWFVRRVHFCWATSRPPAKEERGVTTSICEC